MNTSPLRIVKPRSRERVCELPYVRFVNGWFQSRLWIGTKWGSINLGLYSSEGEAAAASREVLRLMDGDVSDPLSVYRATVRAMASGRVRRDVLPKYVVRIRGNYYGRPVRGTGTLFGPFADPVEACRESIRQLAQADSRSRSAAFASSNSR